MYLEECIESILNQTIGFEKHVQIIFINENSIDNSIEIIKNYKEIYPNNIIITDDIKEEYELNFAKGKYINYLNVTDYLSENTLKNVYFFFEKKIESIDIVSIPTCIIDNSEHEHDLNYKFDDTKVLNILESPNNPQVSIHSSFIKYSVIKNKNYNPQNNIVFFLTDVILEKEKYGIVDNAKYYYRNIGERFQSHDEFLFFKENPSTYLDYYLKLIEKSNYKYGEVLEYIQYTIIYDILDLIKLPQIDTFNNTTFSQEILNTLKINNAKYDYENDKFKEKLKRIIQNIDDSIIINNLNIKNEIIKKFLLYLKYDFKITPVNTSKVLLNVNPLEEDILVTPKLKESEILLTSNNYLIDDLNIHKLWIGKFDIQNNNLIINGFFTSYFNSDKLIFEIIEEESNKIFIAEKFKRNPEKNKIILSQEMEFSVNFKFNIPLQELGETCEFKIRISIKDMPDIYTYVNLGFYSNAKHIEKNSIILNSNYRLSINNKKFKFENIFKFAVVMAIYNTEDFLTDAVDSVINQTIGFEENIQLILIDDGSEDKSLELCKSYAKQYPKNIIVLSQENSGQAVARNNGLKYARAEFVNFLDSDDYFSEETFENVYSFFKEHKQETDIVSIPMKFFDRFEGEHQLNFKYKETKVINLDEEPFNPQYHANSAFFNKDVIDKIQFPVYIVPSEDAMLINKILLRKRTLGVVKDATYYYRKRFDMSSTLDLTNDEKVYFTDRLKKYYLGLFEYAKYTYGNVPKFLEYTLAQDLHWILFQPTLSFAENQFEINEFYYYLKKVLEYISIDTINNLVIDSKDLRSFYLYMKVGELNLNYDENKVSLNIGNRQIDQINYHKLWTDIVEIKNDILYISGLYMGLIGNHYLSITGINKLSNGEVKTSIAEENYYATRTDRDYISQKWKYALNFDLKIPIYKNVKNNIKLKINFHIDGDNSNFNDENIISIELGTAFQHYCSITEHNNYFIKDSYLLSFEDNTYKISPYSYKNMLKQEKQCLKKIYEDKLFYYKHIIVLRLIYLFLFPIIRRLTKNKPIYLFMDRIDAAQDNGEVLWKYSLSQKDNIKKYFVIDKSSKDYKRLSKLGPVISFNSYKHKLIFLFAEKIISSHPEEDVLNPYFSKRYEHDTRQFISGLSVIERYFIEHGVAQYNMSDWLTKYNINIHYYLTSSDFETEGEYNNLSYPKEIYLTLGMPRFDILKNNVSKQILICPTWRFKIMGDSEGDKIRFLNSDYYQFLQDLLNNERLIKLSKEYNCKLIFKPHPRLTHIVGDNNETYVDLLDIDSYIDVSYNESYTELLNKSALMITDYSSVAFDFAYLEKPLIYYQADEIPHERGYFDYETMGFGEVILDNELLIDKIEFYMKNNFENEEKFINRKRNFFKYQDKNNSKRVYESIK